jgi:gluconolactonase
LCHPTNIAYGGEAFDELYIANLGRWHISSIKTEVKGLRLPCHVP